MASVRLVTSADYVHVDKQQAVEIEIAQIYAKHRKSFEEFDFGTPLFALMRLASSKGELSGLEKKTWVLQAHQKLIELAYKDDPLKSEIATASGPSLLEAIYTIVSRVSLFSSDPTAFYTYFSYDADAFTGRLIQKLSPTIKERNLIPMIEVIYWMKLYYLRNSKLNELRDAALEKAFPKEVPADGVYAGIITDEERALYVKLVPIVLDLFEVVANSYVSFSRPKRPPQDEECCSSCLCQ